MTVRIRYMLINPAPVNRVAWSLLKRVRAAEARLVFAIHWRLFDKYQGIIIAILEAHTRNTTRTLCHIFNSSCSDNFSKNEFSDQSAGKHVLN